MSEMMDAILTLPDQLRWGIDLNVDGGTHDGPIVLLGMGGSAMAADVASHATGGAHPVTVHRSYGLPSWAHRSDAAVVAVSYSGNTEEVLSGVEEALAVGLPVSAVASGGRLGEIADERGFPLVTVPAGMQPRAGVGYQTAGVARVLGQVGVIADAAYELTEAASVLDKLLGGGAGPAIDRAATMAKTIAGKTAIIYGGFGVGATAAYRWKTQLNENGKVPAYASVVPEMNHNELEAWHPETGGPFAHVYLHDANDHRRIAERLELSADVIGDTVTAAGVVDSQGSGALARFFSLAVVGDIVSVLVAEQAGTDPVPVETIERFKMQLGKGDQ